MIGDALKVELRTFWQRPTAQMQTFEGGMVRGDLINVSNREKDGLTCIFVPQNEPLTWMVFLLVSLPKESGCRPRQ